MGQSIYISHGGGPMPILDDPSHKQMVSFMKALPDQLERPDAIVVFSAHWEEKTIHIQSGQAPNMLYDYYGFAKEAYEIEYPCQGHPELARRIKDLLEDNHIISQFDEDRPYDHGTYIPLLLMYPQADIPVLQVSLNHSLSPGDHLKIGKALRPLMKEKILFIGSGFSFHNMMAFNMTGRYDPDPLNDAFQEALIEICCHPKNEAEAWSSLDQWDQLAGARHCHPREEHLLPLHVSFALSSNPATKIFDDLILGKRATGFLWNI